MPDNEDDMEAPVTRRELREEFAKFEERFERKLDEKLDEKLEQKFTREFTVFRREIDDKLAEVNRTLSVELARHVNAVAELLRTEIRALGENKPTLTEVLETLPRRVEKLEERVFAPPKRRTPTRATRRR